MGVRNKVGATAPDSTVLAQVLNELATLASTLRELGSLGRSSISVAHEVLSSALSTQLVTVHILVLIVHHGNLLSRLLALLRLLLSDAVSVATKSGLSTGVLHIIPAATTSAREGSTPLGTSISDTAKFLVALDQVVHAIHVSVVHS